MLRRGLRLGALLLDEGSGILQALARERILPGGSRGLLLARHDGLLRGLVVGPGCRCGRARLAQDPLRVAAGLRGRVGLRLGIVCRRVRLVKELRHAVALRPCDAGGLHELRLGLAARGHALLLLLCAPGGDVEVVLRDLQRVVRRGKACLCVRKLRGRVLCLALRVGERCAEPTVREALRREHRGEHLGGLLAPPLPVVTDVVAPVLERDVDATVFKRLLQRALGVDAVLACVLAADKRERQAAEQADRLAALGKRGDHVDRGDVLPALRELSHDKAARVVRARQREEPAEELRPGQHEHARVQRAHARARKHGRTIVPARVRDEGQQVLLDELEEVLDV